MKLKKVVKTVVKTVAAVLSVAMAFGLCGAAGNDVAVAEAAGSVPTIKSCDYLMPEVSLFDMSTDKDRYVLQVEAGNKFYMGDIVSASVTMSNDLSGSYYLISLPATYKSSKTSVCAVNKKTGLVNPRKKGTATITVKYKKQTAKVIVKVVKKGSFKKNSKIQKVAKKIDKYSKVYTGTFDESNAEKMIAAAKKCKKVLEPYIYMDYNAKRYAAEFGFGATKDPESGYYNQNNKLLYPGCAHYHAMESNIGSDIYTKYNPFYSHTVDPVSIKSVTATKGTAKATITLSRSITDLEYTMLSYSSDYISNGVPSVMFYMGNSVNSKYALYADGPITAGSDKIEITLTSAFDKDYNYLDSTSADGKKLLTFQSGATYIFYTSFLFDDSGNVTADTNAAESWAGNYKFTVK